MATVTLQNNDGKGTINYDASKKDGPVVFSIETKHDSIRKAVEKYFTTEREYQIPVSQKIDDYRTDKVVPTKTMMYFELALMEFQAAANIRVFWPINQKGLDKLVV